MQGITLTVYDETNTPIAEVDTAEVLWISRYDTPGSFTIKVPATAETVALYKPRRHIKKEPIESTGIIEKITIEMVAATGGQVLIVSGRTVDCILSHRVWNSWKVSEGTDRLSTIQGFFDGFVGDRKLPITVTGSLPSEDYSISQRGKTLLELVQSLIQDIGAGYTMSYTPNEEALYNIEFFKGTDHSDVIFSPDYENLQKALYENDVTDTATCVYVAGEGEDENRVIQSVSTGETGLSRVEKWVDARDLQKDSKTTDTQYQAILKARGVEILQQTAFTEAFAGDVAFTTQWVYGVDYNLGDRVTVEVPEWGISALYRVVEITEQQNASGYQLQPTFAK